MRLGVPSGAGPEPDVCGWVGDFKERQLSSVPEWREAAGKANSLDFVVAVCMVKEGVGPWQAFKMVKRYAVLNGLYPNFCLPPHDIQPLARWVRK